MERLGRVKGTEEGESHKSSSWVLCAGSFEAKPLT